MDSTALQEREQTTLVDLAAKANFHHEQCTRAANSALDHAHAAGKALLEIKRHCPHGESSSLLRTEFKGSPQTARLYMLVAKRWPQIEAKRQRVGSLSLRQAAALTAQKPRDVLVLVKQAVRLIRRAYDQATTAEVIKACRDLALEAQNTAGEEVLRAERSIGRELMRLQALAHTAPMQPDDDFAATLPELSPDLQLRGIDPGNTSYMVELHPSKAHPGYYHLAVYGDLDTDNADCVYDRRPARYDQQSLAITLRRVHGIEPTCWTSEPALPTEPWFITAPGTPAPVHRYSHPALVTAAGQVRDGADDGDEDPQGGAGDQGGQGGNGDA